MTQPVNGSEPIDTCSRLEAPSSLSCLSHLQDIQNTVLFRTTGPGQTIENCVVRGNFLVNPGQFADARTNAGLSIIGPAAPVLKATSVIYQVGRLTMQALIRFVQYGCQLPK